MRVVVPYAPDAPKTRLESVLSSMERSELARTMLEDVLAAVRGTGHEPLVLSTRQLDVDAPVTIDDRSLSVAVNELLPSETADEPRPVAIVMADLALATTDTLDRLFSRESDVTIAPGRGGGTNAIVVRHPAFRVDYHDGSYLDHRRIAADAGLDLETVDSFRLGVDVDEPADLIDAFVYAPGRTPDCLRSFGLELVVRDGQLSATRDPEFE